MLYSIDFKGMYIEPLIKLCNTKRQKPNKKNIGEDSPLYSPKNPSHEGTSELNGKKKTPIKNKLTYPFSNTFIISILSSDLMTCLIVSLNF